jgi:hypothetical protein
MNNLSSGEIINLMSNDARQIDATAFMFNYMWVVPVVMISISYLFWHFVKYIAFIAIGYTLFVLLVQPLYGRMSVYLRFVIIYLVFLINLIYNF